MRTRKTMLFQLAAISFCVLLQLGVFTAPASCEYPEGAVTLFSGYPAGTVNDLVARSAATMASPLLGQPIVVENKPGGGGTVALGMLMAAKPDGYTLGCTPNVCLIDAALMKKMPFKPLATFDPIIALAAADHTGLLVKKDAPWKTFQEFVEYAKKNPGKVKYCSAGAGTSMHVAMEVIAKRDGIKWVHVPYQDSNTATAAVMGGHVDAISSAVSWPTYVKGGDMRVLATHGEKRSPNCPDVPTIHELGYGYVSDVVHGIVCPAGTPPQIVAKLEKAFKEAVHTPEFKATLDKVFLSFYYHDQKEYRRLLKEKWERTERLFKEMGLITQTATQPN